jgi:hypothetical protein
MAININIGSKEEGDKAAVKLDLNMRKTLDGDYMIFDHADIDIVIMPQKRKIMTFPKELITDQVYGAQNRLFSFLKKKGVVQFDSIQGGNIYGSIEATILESDDNVDPTKYVLLNVSKFIDEERPYFEYAMAKEEEYQERMVNPNNEESTDLGDVEHASEQGSLRPNYMKDMYGHHSILPGL